MNGEDKVKKQISTEKHFEQRNFPSYKKETNNLTTLKIYKERVLKHLK